MLQFLKNNQQHRKEAQDLIVRGMSRDVVNQYEKFYQEYLDKSFQVNKTCSACIGDMVQKIWRWYDKKVEEGILLDFAEVEKPQIEVLANPEQPEQPEQEKPKRTYKKHIK